MDKRNAVPLVVLCVLLGVMVVLPLKVMSYGYMPPDDALRHVAKIFSGRQWSDILVLRNGIILDSHPGWHALLGQVKELLGAGPDGLLFFSVVTLFLLFCCIPLLGGLRRPEAWVVVLAAVSVADPDFIPNRLFLGRPYMISMAVVLLTGLMRRRLSEGRRPYAEMVVISAAIMMATWIHCAWYLFALPVAAFLAARRWKGALRLAVCTVCGVVAGACLTGAPVAFLSQTYMHAVRAFAGGTLSDMLVYEFRPFDGHARILAAVAVLFIWRRLEASGRQRSLTDDPMFMLACIGWLLGFFAVRFWADWGMPALMLWAAGEVQSILQLRQGEFSRSRVVVAVSASLVLLLSVSADFSGRWTRSLYAEHLNAANPVHRELLPGEGGIVYSDSMEIFYETFYANPSGNWKYVLGFEPAMMPEEDLAIYRAIQRDRGAYRSFSPWVKKMRPEDRMILKRSASVPPSISPLEWYSPVKNVWVGKYPRGGYGAESGERSED